MDRSNVAEVYPKLFEFIEREKFGLMPKLFSTKKRCPPCGGGSASGGRPFAGIEAAEGLARSR
jgi:hypothetical protein